jgi:flagellar basal body-associated protein FliL
MLGRLLPLILAVVGLGAGAAAGIVLRPAPEPEQDGGSADTAEAAPAEGDPAALPEYVRLSNQFVIPVVEDGRVSALVILSLSLEVTIGSTAEVYAREPRLRDALLQVMFDHANAGGFRGSFTDGANLVLLRSAMRETARRVLGDLVLDVLISDIVRQDA